MFRRILLLISLCAVSTCSIFAQTIATEAQSPELRGTLAVPIEAEPDKSQLGTGADLKKTWHRATLHLSGSMCPACLLDLEGKLRKLPGVVYAKIKWQALASDSAPGASTSDANAKIAQKPTGAGKTATTIIIYDQHESSWQRLEHFIKANKYKCLDTNDEAYR